MSGRQGVPCQRQHAPQCSGGSEKSGRSRRSSSTTPGGRRARQDAGSPACATPTSTPSPATCRSAARSSGATRAPVSSRPSARASHGRRRRPRLDVVRPALRPLPVVLDGPPVPLRRGRQALRHRHDERRPRGAPHRCNGQPIGRYAQVGTFSEHVLVSEDSVIKVETGPALRRGGARLVRRRHRVRLGDRAGRHQARRQRGRHRRRRHRHQRRAGRPGSPARSASSPSTRSSSSGSRPCSSAPPTPTRRSRRRWLAVAGPDLGRHVRPRRAVRRRRARRHDRPCARPDRQGRHPRGHRPRTDAGDRRPAQPVHAVDDEQGGEGHRSSGPRTPGR